MIQDPGNDVSGATYVDILAVYAAPTFKWDTYQGVGAYTMVSAHVVALGFDNLLTMDNLTLNIFPMDDSAWLDHAHRHLVLDCPGI